MKSLFKQIIIEFHNEFLPQPIARDIQLPSLPKNVRKAFVYIGMRRSGKTWGLYQRMHELISKGIDQTQMLYINFEDDRLSNVSVNDLQLILEAYWELYPQYIDNKQLYFFFDEIAEVDSWESFIRRLLDKEHMQIYLSGSSAKMLSKEIATSLRGRTITREIFPMSFKEYLSSKGVSVNKTLTIKQKAVLKNHFERYLQFGGFPEILGTEASLHREILQGYMDSVIYRDIIERHHVKNHIALHQLLLHCLQNATGLLSVNKLFQQFKSRGMSVGKDSLYEYVNYFEDAYCLFPVSVYSFSLNKAELKPKKIYPIDTGLITAYSIKPGYDNAASLETAAFLHLRRLYQEIFYYQTQQGKEIDFLTIRPNGKMQLYQVSLTLKDEDTRTRELTAITQAMGELKLKQATIITQDESETIHTKEGHIHIVPLWQFIPNT